MFAVVQNGEVRQIIQPDVAFTIGDKQYSARFIRNATEEERKAVGVYEIIYGQQKDQRFYWVDGPKYRVNEVNQTVEATFSATPKDLEPLKIQQSQQINQIAYTILLPTDWMVVKAIETQSTVATEWSTWRASIRSAADVARAAVMACTTVEELESLPSVNWPRNPDQPAEVTQ